MSSLAEASVVSVLPLVELRKCGPHVTSIIFSMFSSVPVQICEVRTLDMHICFLRISLFFKHVQNLSCFTTFLSLIEGVVKQ